MNDRCKCCQNLLSEEEVADGETMCDDCFEDEEADWDDDEDDDDEWD